MKHIEDTDLQNGQQQQNEQSSNTGVFESTVNTSFFCTNDRALERIDNNEIFQHMVSCYEQLGQNNEDTSIKKTIVAMLNDEDFIYDLLEYYSISMQDVFKILYAQYSGIFKGPYLKKIRNIIEDKQYI